MLIIKATSGLKPSLVSTTKKSHEAKVWNRYHKNAPQGAVGIERNTKWGNPFSHLDSTLAQFKVATREESIEKFKELLLSDPVAIETVKRELKGKHLVCCCKPRACHGDVLLEVANQ